MPGGAPETAKVLASRLANAEGGTQLGDRSFLFHKGENSPLLAFAVHTAAAHGCAFHVLIIEKAVELSIPAPSNQPPSSGVLYTL